MKRFKEVQRLQTQLDQYTDLTEEQKQEIEQTLPKDDLRAFRGAYLDTAQRLKHAEHGADRAGEPPAARPERSTISTSSSSSSPPPRSTTTTS
ncbi:MAG: hypothetical protein U5K76_03285 [Woeseiaceae bacterium]|nr:hypothetical protein [Woeseiaceae bacterium]